MGREHIDIYLSLIKVLLVPIHSSHVQQERGYCLSVQPAGGSDGSSQRLDGEMVVCVSRNDAVSDRGFS